MKRRGKASIPNPYGEVWTESGVQEEMWMIRRAGWEVIEVIEERVTGTRYWFYVK